MNDRADRDADNERSGSGFDSFLREVAHAPGAVPESAVGRTIGRYRIEALLGQGGMGRVYEAEDTELGRKVAIKLLRPELSGSDGDERFVRERRVTAELEHPGIVPIYDSGVSPEGEPYYVMRIARGDPFDRLVDRAATMDARLALLPNLIAVADAIAFAHSHGIVHRDLKPTNVLVGAFGETLVADWGIAKRLRTEEAHDATHLEAASPDPGATRDGAVVGTRAYMPPEQADGRPVDERADVYALGAMLHQLVTGRPPGGAGREGLEASASGAMRDIRAIVGKAIAVDPAARYQRAADLAEELRRFQTGQVLTARDYSRAELALRWARRHRAQLSVAAVLCVVLAVVVVVGVIRILRERNVALAERTRADTARDSLAVRNDELVLLQARAELTRDPTASMAWLKRYPATASGWQEAGRIAADAWTRGVASRVWNLGSPLGSVAFSPDGTRVATGSLDGTLTVVDLRSGTRSTFHAPDGVGSRVAFSPDGRWLATTDGTEVVRLWDAAAGSSRRLEGEHAGGATLEFSPDGSLLRVHHPGIGTRLWRIPSGEPVPLPPGNNPNVAFLPAANTVVMAVGPALSVVDLSTGQIGATTKLDGPAYDLRASGDGAWIAASRSNSFALWSPATGVVRKVAAGQGAVGILTSSRDGLTFAACGSVYSPNLWVFGTDGAPARQLSTDERCARQAFEFSPDGTLFVSTGFGDELRVHDVAEGRARLLKGHDSAVADAAFSPDGHSIASVSSDHTLRLWRIDDGDLRVLHGVEGLDALSARNDVLVQNKDSGVISLVASRSGESTALVGADLQSPLRSRGALSSDGRIAVSYEAAGTLVVWDLDAGTHRKVAIANGTDAGVYGEALSPHGSMLLQGDGRGGITIVDLGTGQARLLGRLGDRVFAVAWSADERLVGAGGRDSTARAWDVATGMEKGRTKAGGWVWGIAFSRDGGRLGIASADGIARVLDLADGRVTELSGHVGTASWVDFTPDGRRLLSTGSDGTVRSWDLETRVGTIVRREPQSIVFAAFSPDGSLVMLKDSSSKVRIWDSRVGPPLDANSAELARWMNDVTNAEVDERGHLQSPLPPEGTAPAPDR